MADTAFKLEQRVTKPRWAVRRYGRSKLAGVAIAVARSRTGGALARFAQSSVFSMTMGLGDRPRSASLRGDWCRRNRHRPLRDQHAHLSAMMREQWMKPMHEVVWRRRSKVRESGPGFGRATRLNNLSPLDSAACAWKPATLRPISL